MSLAFHDGMKGAFINCYIKIKNLNVNFNILR